MSKKELVFYASYVIGAFVTNSYCRNCRWDEWKGPRPEREMYASNIEFEDSLRFYGHAAFFKTSAATIFWPIYAASRACDAGVGYASNIELKWK